MHKFMKIHSLFKKVPPALLNLGEDMAICSQTIQASAEIIGLSEKIKRSKKILLLFFINSRKAIAGTITGILVVFTIQRSWIVFGRCRF